MHSTVNVVLLAETAACLRSQNLWVGGSYGTDGPPLLHITGLGRLESSGDPEAGAGIMCGLLSVGLCSWRECHRGRQEDHTAGRHKVSDLRNHSMSPSPRPCKTQEGTQTPLGREKGIWGESAVEAVFGKYGQPASMCLVFLTWNTRYTPTSCVFEETWHLSCRPSHIMDLTASFSSYTSFKLDTSCKGPIRFTVAYVADICLF